MDKEFWRSKHVFITGCTGLLGSWLTAELVSLGAEVVGLVRDQVPQSQLVYSGTIDKIRVVRGDVCDYSLMERTLAEYEIDTVFHLAAQTIVGIANRVPMSTFETNIRGTWVVLEAARRNPTVRRVAVASSDKAYGDQDTLPYREDAPLQGRYPYDVSKSCVDLIARAYATTYELPVVVTRCANMYGGGDLNWNRIVPGTIRSVLEGNAPIIRSDGTPKRDYIYVRDAVNAYLTVTARADEPEILGQAFNFGMDQPVSVLEMVEAIIAISGDSNIEPVILDEVAHEIQDQYLDSTKAREMLGWRPAYDLATSLAETYEWYRMYLGY
ncbi:MAG: NAD-dependent epimerase/dehydratase family protein [Chloroflexi bacterium]|nr:MAG: NAD-dependent epimerase/dehydratase family protein [Chloroflexota bacterium]